MIDFYFFLVGSILASFLGLVIDRFPEQSIISPASHCGSCQTRLPSVRPNSYPLSGLQSLSLSLLQGPLSCLVCTLWIRFRAHLSGLLSGIAFFGSSHPNHCWFDLGHLRLPSSGISLARLADFSLNPHGLLWLESSYDFLSYLGNFGSLYRYPHRCRWFSLSGLLCTYF